MNVMTKNALLQKVREAAFEKQEMILYMDTHPGDRAAMHHFCEVRDRCAKLTAEYEKTYGPLTASGVSCDRGWTWVDSPWPWQRPQDVAAAPVKAYAAMQNTGCAHGGYPMARRGK